jgi:hypothetical protein
VLEPNFDLRRERARWGSLLFIFALIAAAATLSSCGSSASSSTTTTPSITISCNPTSVTVLGTSQCTATVLNVSSTLVNWSVSGTGNGSISSGGLYTAPATVPTNNVVTITAVSQVQSTLTATESLTLQKAVAINAVTCNDSQGHLASAVSSGDQLDCRATASTGAIVPVNWSVANTNNPAVILNTGSISSQGVYTAPLIPPQGQSVTITATSQALATETMSVMVTVNFGDKVLSGSYVFSASGRLTNTSKAFWARVGSFSAGGGSLTGFEDTNQGGAPNIVTTLRAFTGSYSIGPDGRGSMQFCENGSPACPLGSLSATAFFRIVLISPQRAQIIEFSSPSTASALTTAGGEILSQDQLVSPSNGNLAGAYSFNFAGVSTATTEESAIGEFAANGFGTIGQGSAASPGEMEINAGGPVPLATTPYSISSNGRGTVALNGLNFSFYPVSASRVKFIEIDTAALATPTTPASILVGDAYKQQTSLTCGWGLNALNGSTVFETSGLDTRLGSPGVVIADVGAFTASNNGATGAVSAGSVDENSGGTVSSTLGTLTGAYSLDSCGRGTLGIGSRAYVFYIISPSDAVLQETTSGVIAHGLLMPSLDGPFANGTLTGSYAFRLGGTDAAGTSGNREDFLGQMTSDGKGNVTGGSLDLNDIGATQTGCVPLTTNCIAITNGTYLPTPLPPPTVSLRATMTLPLSTTPATNRKLVLYMVSPTLFFALDTDTTGTGIGAIFNQF